MLLAKGVDGFRVDVISLISKRNYEDSPYQDFNNTISNIYANRPRIHEYLQERNREVISKYDMMTVGEEPRITLENGLEYAGKDREELNMVFHFDHMFMAGQASLIRGQLILWNWDKKFEYN